ncbi:2-polyprenyl-6-methoxyphenol hydroxylase-like FAD-dependent oxidoreductase [Streptosporangium becharense]|uniref:2-polyprenyl-6-methoxyphenol hydroxylase-like FAD-dependent oxidoreductase n=1 Tax=Streptosporangium becharense TaxID=1816182 RepID=A0A7W9MEA7_9ACTN|nr:FAD-dependent monooxygenase [Streptosporangium becharense]MBB2914244.1 2-polyprenyl-6-methoxyphenol hydroxylase-like FAD-dependent oxidoreductase [Streptosporangium becharense]MBB5817271.1 2-polyprenyl-6-methoxyphenol hydroxylase-like FAD-dependent oxidoreductase [Streptosporangium becharense]
MAAVGNVLIVGGGTAGSALAILLARGGVAVDIAEIKPELTALGSGITLQGNALRVLRDLGVWDRVGAAGFAFDSLGLRTPGGDLIAEIPDARTGGPDLPATLGMNRPELAAILADAVRDAGARIRLGLTVNALTDTGDGVRAELSDGTSGTYDLVVGADGIRSKVRGMIGVDVAPRPTGMGIWRVHTRRPEHVERTDLIYGGPCFIAGYCPTGPQSMYAYLVERARPRESVADADKPAHMLALAQGYGGTWDEIRADITDPGRINYTWFESLLVDRPWNRGRTVLIGDAAHACPPTLAQGAAQCLEDAAVLAELLLAADRLDRSLFDAFTDRRYERVRAVVEASLQLADWQLNPVPGADVPGLMGRTAAMVTQHP